MTDEEFRKRREALEYAQKVNIILDEKFFPCVWKAVKERNEQLFEQCCKDAGITDTKMIRCLKGKLVTGESTDSPAW